MPVRSRIACLIGLSLSIGATAAPVAHADVLIHQTFEQTDAGKWPEGPQPVGTFEKLESDNTGALGSITVATIDTPAGQTKAAQISNVAHKEGSAASLNMTWEDPKSGILRLEYRFMTPIDGQFLSVHYLGGDWNNGAAVFIVENGQLIIQYGEKGARLPLGTYKANEWHGVRFDFDVSNRKLDVYVDGEKRGNQLPWQTGAEGIANAGLFADFRPTDHGGAPVLYIDDINVETIGTAAATAAPTTAPFAPLKSADRFFRYAVCSHLHRYQGANFDKMVDAIDRLGVDTVRDGDDWNAIEPAEGVWKFDRMDKIVNDLGAHGIELQTLLCFTAKWASTGPTNTRDWHDWNNHAPRMEPFQTYAKTMVDRYKDRVHYWEIWNEPEIGFWLSTPAEYVDLFNKTSATIKQADPTAKVLNGGFSLERRPPNMNFLQEFLPGADTTNWDIWAYHDYATFGQMIAREKQNKQYYNSKQATMPIWINEGGFHTLLRGGEQEQAITLVKKMATAPSFGVGCYVWYDLIDDGDKPEEPEDHFGLLHTDFSPKPSYIAYQEVIHELAPLKFAKQLPTAQNIPGLWGMIYQSPNDQHDNVLVLWREGKGRQTPLWVGTSNGGSATAVYSMDGQIIPAPQMDGGMLVTVSDSPVYVHLHGSIEPVIKPFLSLPDKLAVLPGHDNLLKIQITNPTDHEATFNVAFSADSAAITVGAQPSDSHLAAGESTTLATNARLVDSATGAAAGAITVSLRPSTGGPAVTAQLPYVVAAALPKLSESSALDIPGDQGLKLSMKTHDSIVNLYSAEPNPPMHWQGPDDLSATARVAYSQDAFYLHAIVTDDKHVQPNKGAEIWRSDAMQLAIRTDDSRAEYFEAGLALGDDGKPSGWVYMTTPGSPLAVGVMDKSITYDVKREGNLTHYIVRIPWKSLGSDGPPANGLRMNFIVNDDDGLGRKGWVQVSDGIGKDKDPSMFNLFVCN